MHKKLNGDDLIHIMETGIDEFADKGFDKANINHIAKNAGVSVGVIYKYYNTKDEFFLKCVRHSLETLDSVLSDAFSGGHTTEETIYSIIRALQKCGKEHRNYYIMYHEITSGSCRKYANLLAEEIESRTARIYSEMFQKTSSAKDNEDSKLCAFLFDNILMMLQFSYSCDYYRQRMKIYCGDDCFDNDEKLAKNITNYICKAFSLKEM